MVFSFGYGSEVFNIYVDEFNNKWICIAEVGLVKFDGIGWTIYNTSNSGLPSNIVFEISEDKEKNKWIATMNGVVKFDGKNWTVYNTSNSGLPEDWCIGLKVIDENVWIGTPRSGLVKFDGRNWTVYDTSNSPLPHNWVKAIEKEKNNIWIGTLGGLVKFDGENWTIYKPSNSGLPDSNIFTITIDKEGNKWIGTFLGGLVKFDGENWTVYDTSNSKILDKLVTAIAIDSQGNKWIGTFEGLCKFDGKNWVSYRNLIPPLRGVIVSIAIDKLNNKWIGNIFGEIVVFREGGIILPVEKENIIPSDFVLYQNYPNPFNSSTVIEFEIKKRSKVKLIVLDVLGREVSKILDEYLDEGRYKVNFSGYNLPSGVYFYRLETDGQTETKKMVLLK
jgi:ligand-binding sensor domain-containing protein